MTSLHYLVSVLPIANKADSQSCKVSGFFAPLPFCPLDDSPPGSFTPWLVRLLACSPPYVVSLRYDDRNYAYNLLFILFQGFVFRLRLYEERQLYNSIIKASLFRQIRKPKPTAASVQSNAGILNVVINNQYTKYGRLLYIIMLC